MSIVIIVKKIGRLLVWKYSHVYTVLYGYVEQWLHPDTARGCWFIIFCTFFFVCPAVPGPHIFGQICILLSAADYFLARGWLSWLSAVVYWFSWVFQGSVGRVPFVSYSPPPPPPSGTTTSLFESFGLLNYFLPFNPILDAFCSIIFFRNSIFFYIIFPSNFWSSCQSCRYQFPLI